MTILLIIIFLALVVYSYLYILNPTFYKNMLPPLEFYLKSFNNIKDYTLHDVFRVSIYKAPNDNCYMIIVKPQNYHFFIENGKFIYHPQKNDNLSKYYTCPLFFDKAYQLPVTKNENNEQSQKNKNELVNKMEREYPKIICHRNLKYLNNNVYVKKIHQKSFKDFNRVMKVLAYSLDVLKTYSKMDKYYREHHLSLL